MRLARVRGKPGQDTCRDGMEIARGKGKLRAKKPAPSENQYRELRRMRDRGAASMNGLADIFAVSKSVT